MIVTDMQLNQRGAIFWFKYNRYFQSSLHYPDVSSVGINFSWGVADQNSCVEKGRLAGEDFFNPENKQKIMNASNKYNGTPFKSIKSSTATRSGIL